MAISHIVQGVCTCDKTLAVIDRSRRHGHFSHCRGYVCACGRTLTVTGKSSHHGHLSHCAAHIYVRHRW